MFYSVKVKLPENNSSVWAITMDDCGLSMCEGALYDAKVGFTSQLKGRLDNVLYWTDDGERVRGRFFGVRNDYKNLMRLLTCMREVEDATTDSCRVLDYVVRHLNVVFAKEREIVSLHTANSELAEAAIEKPPYKEDLLREIETMRIANGELQDKIAELEQKCAKYALEHARRTISNADGYSWASSAPPVTMEGDPAFNELYNETLQALRGGVKVMASPAKLLEFLNEHLLALHSNQNYRELVESLGDCIAERRTEAYLKEEIKQLQEEVSVPKKLVPASERKEEPEEKKFYMSVNNYEIDESLPIFLGLNFGGGYYYWNNVLRDRDCILEATFVASDDPKIYPNVSSPDVEVLSCKTVDSSVEAFTYCGVPGKYIGCIVRQIPKPLSERDIADYIRHYVLDCGEVGSDGRVEFAIKNLFGTWFVDRTKGKKSLYFYGWDGQGVKPRDIASICKLPVVGLSLTPDGNDLVISSVDKRRFTHVFCVLFIERVAGKPGGSWT